MKNNSTDRSGFISLFPVAASWAAAVLIAGSIGGLWFLLAEDALGTFALLAGPLGLIAVFGVYWQHVRARAARQFWAALDAYAEREIARQRRASARRKPRTLSTALGVSSSVRVSRTYPRQLLNRESES